MLCRSCLLIGDSDVGWRGTSIFAHFLLILISGLVFIQAGAPIFGLAIALLMGLDGHFLVAGISTRMYMVTALSALPQGRIRR